MKRTTSLQRLISVASGLVCASCVDGVVGVEPCTSQSPECIALPLGAAVAPVRSLTQIPVKDLEVVTPTWTKPLPIAVPLEELNTHYPYNAIKLVSDRDHNMWLFAVDLAAEGMRVSRIDSDGNVIATSLISPPDGALLPSQSPTLTLLPSPGPEWTASTARASATITWQTPCPPTDEDGLCPVSEKVIFQGGLSEPPLRVPMNSSVLDVFENDRGELFRVDREVPGKPPTVSKLDSELRSVWTSTFMQDEWTFADVDVVPLGDGRLAANATVSLSTTSGNLLFLIDPDGKVTRSWDPTSSASKLLAVEDRPVLAGSDPNGNLIVRFVEEAPPSSESVAFMRQDYTLMYTKAAASDPSGRVYVFTLTGDHDDQRPALCRATSDATGRCIALPKLVDPGSNEELLFDEIIAQEDGVVFGRVNTSLVRLQFPD